MTIIKKKKYIMVIPEDGYILFDGIYYSEGVSCPLDVNPLEIYTEITLEEYEELLINQQSNEIMEDEEDGSDDNWTNN